MAFRKVEPKDFEGKTITINGVDATACNVVKLTFADGSKLELWAEDAVACPPFGYIPGIFVDDPDSEGGLK